MPAAVLPARKSLVQLTYELIEADARKAKRAAKVEEAPPPAPVKKVPAKKAAKKQSTRKGKAK